jgi:alpha-L-fucosidase
MKSSLFTYAQLAICFTWHDVFCQGSLPVEKQWFTKDKYGVFIHWCIENPPKFLIENNKAYAAKARENAKSFTANQYKPEDWAAMFKNWGARYAVLTTKHHIGFALFDTPRSKFTSKKSSPARRDVLGDYCDAMRKEGLKVGLYYSLPDRSHPFYNSLKFKEDGKTLDSAASDLKKWKQFTDDMLFEVSHLCRNYGKIDLFWFDGDWERSAEQWRSIQIMDTVKKYQPWAVVNNRLRHRELGDYATPEMVIPMKAPTGYAAWELCTTLGYNWNGDDAYKHLKEPEELVQILMHTIGLGGNLLLNVAPDMSGQISKEQQEKMSALGQWINTHAEAILGTESGLNTGHYESPSTSKGNKLYLYVPPGRTGKLVLKNVSGQIESARILGEQKPLMHTALRDYHEEKVGAKNWKYIHLPQNLSSLGLIIEVTWKAPGWKVD